MEKEIRCGICGRFISEKYLNEGKAIVDFIPDTLETVERIEFFHSECYYAGKPSSLNKILGKNEKT